MAQANINKPEASKIDSSPAVTAAASVESTDTDNRQPKQSPVLPALFWLLIGGLIGFLIGRQSVAAPVVESAVSAPTAMAVDTVPESLLDAADLPGSEAASAAGSVQAGPTPASIAPETLRTLGDPNAPVTIVEYSDYQCPFCLRHFQQTMPQLKAEYIDTGRVYYVFKDFPITSLHPVAPRIHEAARCAGGIGGSDAYWQAHDSFFTNNQQLLGIQQPDLDDLLVAFLGEVELDEAMVRECLESGRYTEAVNADLAEGRQLGITGTPAFFVNGYPVPGAQPYAVFQQVIALAEEGRLAEAYQTQPAANDGPAPAENPVTVPLSGDEPAKGAADAPIIIVEYSDFQCPFCQRHFQQTLPQLQSYIEAGQVRYIFKDFPILNIHPEAQKAHESARCAFELGGDDGFWAMHDLLFANQDEWAGSGNHVEIFKAFAVDLELPQSDFDDCLDSDRYAAVVSAQVDEGVQLGIRGTPSFFINGRPLVGAQPFSTFQQIIDTMLLDQN